MRNYIEQQLDVLDIEAAAPIIREIAAATGDDTSNILTYAVTLFEDRDYRHWLRSTIDGTNTTDVIDQAMSADAKARMQHWCNFRRTQENRDALDAVASRALELSRCVKKWENKLESIEGLYNGYYEDGMDQEVQCYNYQDLDETKDSVRYLEAVAIASKGPAELETSMTALENAVKRDLSGIWDIRGPWGDVEDSRFDSIRRSCL